MAMVEWAHYCEDGYHDKNGKPCIIGVTDYVQIPQSGFPAKLTGGKIAVSLLGSPGEAIDLRIRFARHGVARHLLELSSGFSIGPAPRTTVFIANQGMPADEPGAYEFRVSLQREPPIVVPLAVYPVPKR